MSSKIKVDTIENVAGSGNVSLGSGHNLVVPGNNTTSGNATVGGTLGVTGNATFTGDIIKSTSGTSNFAAGVNAGNSITSGGSNNVLVGDEAGTAITTGIQNTIVGDSAGDALNDADFNVAIGRSALSADTKGNKSVAVGVGALQSQNFTSSTDTFNTAVGLNAGSAVSTGQFNTLLGAAAGEANQTGGSNTYVGRSSGVVASGASNTFVGAFSGSQVSNGERNTFVGRYQGNSGGFDLRTTNNHIVLSDGEGNPSQVIYPSNNVNYGNAVVWKSFVKKTGTPAATANAITLGQSRITLTNNTATNIASGYYGNLVMVFTHSQNAPYNYQYTFLVSSGWNSASVLFTNSYGGNNTTFTFSASSGVMKCHQNSGANVECTVLMLSNSYLPSS